MIVRCSGLFAWLLLAFLATCVYPRPTGAALFAVALTATVAHALELWRFLRDGLDPFDGDDDGAAGGSAP